MGARREDSRSAAASRHPGPRRVGGEYSRTRQAELDRRAVPRVTAAHANDSGPARGGSVADEPTYEARSIEYIPLAQRRGSPTDLAWMRAGALFNVEYVVYGSLIMSFGLRFWQAAVVILVGNLSYVMTGLASLQGPLAGTAAFTINRAPCGPRGAKLIAAFNWIMQVGYEIEGLALVVLAGLALFNQAGARRLDRG
jgi:hypothetical protein